MASISLINIQKRFKNIWLLKKEQENKPIRNPRYEEYKS